MLILISLTLLGEATAALADNLIIDTFDTNISGIVWSNFKDYVTGHDMVWDGSQDAGGNPNSGSLYLTLNWPLTSDPKWNSSWQDAQLFWATPLINPADYINFECDIKIDVANSFPALDGSYGRLGLYVNNPSWGTVAAYVPLANTNGWQHIAGSFSAVPGGTTYSQAILGFISNAGSALTNTVALWVDNIIFTALPLAPTRIATPMIVGGQIVFEVVGGLPTQTSVVQLATNLTAPVFWANVGTNTGTFSFTNSAALPESYYRVLVR